MGALDPSPSQRAAHDPFDGATGNGSDRHLVRDEQPGRSDARPATFDIGYERIADLLRQRQPLRAARFAGDGKAPVPPIDMAELEVGHLACPQSVTDKEQNDGSVA